MAYSVNSKQSRYMHMEMEINYSICFPLYNNNIREREAESQWLSSSEKEIVKTKMSSSTTG